MYAEDAEQESDLKSIVLAPLYLYVFYLLYTQPAGWLLINILVPMKALAEYASIHEKILIYILKRDEPLDAKYQRLFLSLIANLSNKLITLGMMCTFHAAIMSASTHTIGFTLVFLAVMTFIIKLTRFHFFMWYPTEEYAKLVSEPDFQRDALILSCLSLFLEVFGHICISLLSALGYYVYTMRRQYILIILILSASADFARQQIGVRFGRYPFARYVAPSMRLEGAIMAIIGPMLVSVGLFHLASRPDGEYLPKLTFYDYFMMG